MNRIAPTRSVLLVGTALACLSVWLMLASQRRNAQAPSPDAAVFAAKLSFNEHVQPILANNCYECHGLDSGTREADLRLDREEFAFAPRKNGPVIIPGDPDNSPLVRRIESTQENEIMPPPASHKSLKPEEIALLRRWVAQGAEYEEHWAYLRAERPELPVTANKDWAQNEIDRFVLARLEKEGLSPSPEADKYALIRRVSYDLTGLPPSLEEVAEFWYDESPDAYERLVDRLLASPRYGEHRAHYWLDAARAGDTTGLHRDPFRRSWMYRDYVIRAFNENKPYDRFATEQIAGDLLPAESFDQLVATDFNRFHVTQSTSGEVTEELQLYNVTDRVDTVSNIFLGVTASCAACHDHKFDRISQKEFYQLSAFFNNSVDAPFDNEQPTFYPTITLPPAGKEEKAKAILKQRAEVERKLAERLGRADELLRAWIASEEARSLKPVSTEKLIARFRLDEGQGDTVVNSAPEADPTHYATRYAPPVWGGEVARHWPAMRMAAATVLPLGQLGDFESTDAFSVSGWVKPRVGRGSNNGSLISKMDLVERTERGSGRGARGRPPNRGWDLFWASATVPGDVSTRFPSGQMVVNLIHDGTRNAISVRAHRPMSRLWWNHVAFTYDGSGKASGLRLYINGELQEDVEVVTDNLQGSIRTAAPLMLDGRTDYDVLEGTASVNPSSLVETAFQDVRVYARRLNDEEIRGTMNRDVVSELLARPMHEWNPDERKVVSDFFFRELDAVTLALTAEKARLDEALEQATRDGIRAYVMEEKDAMPADYVRERGEYNQLRERVWADVPAFLPPLPEGAPANRLGFARWLFTRDHPLTARVSVNRMWAELFGTGIVETLADFGVVGERPSHPQLLDWLAVDFAENGWDLKRLYKQMVMSATYRQAANITPELLEKDPGNRLLARGPRFRISGEMIRDGALAAAGILVEKPGGPGVHLYEPPGIWEALSMHNSPTKTHVPSEGEEVYRRSVYTFWKRLSPPPIFTTFDAPDRTVCVIQRERTNTPLQALVLLNAPDFLEAARHIAARAMRQADTAPEQKVDFMAALVLTRPLAEEQRNVLLKSYDYFLEEFSEQEAREFLQVGDSPVDGSLPARQQAALMVVASQLLNTDQNLNK